MNGYHSFCTSFVCGTQPEFKLSKIRVKLNRRVFETVMVTSWPVTVHCVFQIEAQQSVNLHVTSSRV